MLKKTALIMMAALTLAGCGDFEWFPDGTKPKAFSFTTKTNVKPSIPVDSDPVTISGNVYPAKISVVGGEYKIDDGAYTSASGTINSGQKVTVRHTSATTNDTSTTTTLKISSISATFTSVTEAAPANTNVSAFTFNSKTNVEFSTLVESDLTTITGTASPWDISIISGEYAIDSGAYTKTADKINAGQSVKVRHTSAATPNTATTTTLTIEKWAVDFVSVTRASTVFSNYSAPKQVTKSGNITVTVPPTATVRSRDATNVFFNISFSFTNLDVLARSVNFTLAGLDSQGRKIHPGYFLFSKDINPNTGLDVTQIINTSLPPAIYDNIKTWIFRQIN